MVLNSRLASPERGFVRAPRHGGDVVGFLSLVMHLVSLIRANKSISLGIDVLASVSVRVRAWCYRSSRIGLADIAPVSAAKEVG